MGTKPDHGVTQQVSSMTCGSSSPPTSKTSPLQALNLTDPRAAGWSSVDLHTETFRQWIMMCCTASELNRCKKFNWTRPTVIAGCSNRKNRHLCRFYNVKSFADISRVLICLFYTFDAVIGFRQVCPPPVKLQETSIVSEEQPRLGSIQ